MNQKKNISLIVLAVVLLCVIGYFGLIKKQISRVPLTPSPNPVLIGGECEQKTGFTVAAYQEGWKEIFKKENNLSEPEFSDYITVTEASLLPIGNTCELSVRYKIKKDWISTERQDRMVLGVPPTISPNNLPKEHGTETIGRIGVSTINLHDQLSFGSNKDALNFFVKKYNLSNTNAKIIGEDFSYFWDGKYTTNPDGTMKSQETGEGGRAYIIISGTINLAQNKCYRGNLFLMSKETTYDDAPCVIN